MNTPISSHTNTKHSYIEELNNKASTTQKSHIYFLPRETPTHINTINTTLSTRLLSSRTNTQLRDSHLSPLEATTEQAAVSNADKVPLLGYPGPLFKTRPAHNIQSQDNNTIRPVPRIINKSQDNNTIRPVPCIMYNPQTITLSAIYTLNVRSLRIYCISSIFRLVYCFAVTWQPQILIPANLNTQ